MHSNPIYTTGRSVFVLNLEMFCILTSSEMRGNVFAQIFAQIKTRTSCCWLKADWDSVWLDSVWCKQSPSNLGDLLPLRMPSVQALGTDVWYLLACELLQGRGDGKCWTITFSLDQLWFDMDAPLPIVKQTPWHLTVLFSTEILLATLQVHSSKVEYYAIQIYIYIF